MASCEAYEIGIEKRQHGLLSAEASAELDAHLATCSSCQAYRDLALGMGKVMTGIAAQPQVSLETLVQRFELEKRRAFVPFIVASVMGLGTLAVAPATPVVAAFGIAGMGLITTLGLRGRSWARIREASYASSENSLLELYRRDIERRIRMLRVMLGVIPFVAGAMLTQYALHRWPKTLQGPEFLAVVAAPMVAALVFIVVRNFREVPRLQRERDLLERR